MQSVSAAFTAEEKDSVRKVVGDLLVSWKKDNILGNRTFTVGVSTIGGNDFIGINPGAIGGPGNYRYFDESDYLLGAAWERALNMPVGGLSMALAEARLENTAGRFTPHYMGGNSELFSAILPRRPMIINAGFDFDGIGQTIPQFSGVFNYAPKIENRSKQISLKGADFIDFFRNRYIEQTVMYTSETTDTLIEGLFSAMGMSTAQYDLDPGLNTIPFSMFEKGTRFSDIINDLVQSENGHLYQDEEGKFRFENRQHWYGTPHDSVAKIIYTAQVLDSQAPDEDHIINVVEIKGKEIVKQALQPIMNFSIATLIEANGTVDIFVDYDNPVLEVVAPTIGGADSYYIANSSSDGTGTDVTSSVSVKSMSNFATTSKIVFQNNSGSDLYLTQLVVSGRMAKTISDIYVRNHRGPSVTAYEERVYTYENKHIQDKTWANSLSELILNDFANPENLQKITIRAMPSLQVGDLISWQGKYWRIFGISSTLNPSVGFVQELSLLQRPIQQYFTIGISTIGGSHQIAA